MKQTFYMVFAESGMNPTFRHATYELALTEAKRLSGLLKRKTWVLEAVTAVEKIQFKIEELVERDKDSLPF